MYPGLTGQETTLEVKLKKEKAPDEWQGTLREKQLVLKGCRPVRRCFFPIK